MGLAAHVATASADVTAPVITRVLTGTPGDAGWFRGTLNIRWDVVDPESPWTTTGCDARTFTQETAGTTVECRAVSAGGISSDGLVVKLDSTPPPAATAAPDRPADRNGWFNHPVSVRFSGTDALSGVATCTVATYAGPDTRRARVAGTCRDLAGNQSAPLTFGLRYDATAPVRIRARAGRRPDHRGWYSHPVRFRFRARDALSGHARCAPVTYHRGPDGRRIVRGACADRAGNVATRDVRLRYDATPPGVRLRLTAGHRMVAARWRASPDARSFTLRRWVVGRPSTRTVVYRGARRRHLDTGVRDGLRYRYALVAVDRAGNRATARRRARPGAG